MIGTLIAIILILYVISVIIALNFIIKTDYGTEEYKSKPFFSRILVIGIFLYFFFTYPVIYWTTILIGFSFLAVKIYKYRQESLNSAS